MSRVRTSAAVVLTDEQLDEVVAAYSEFDALAFDVETRGEHRSDPRRGEVFWISLAGPGRADVVPMGHPLGRITGHTYAKFRRDGQPYANAKPIAVFGPPPAQLSAETVFEALHPLFFSDRVKVAHNAKFDLQAVSQFYGDVPPGPYADTQVMAHLVNEVHTGPVPYSLGSCVKREFRWEYDKSLGKIGVETFPFNEAGTYSYMDAKYCWLLYRQLLPRIQQQELEDVFNVEMAVLRTVVWMEQTGVCIDEDGLRSLETELATQIAEVEAKVRQDAGWEINLSANRQVAKLVFGDRGHRPQIETEKMAEPSVSEEALRPYKKDPVVANILHWRDLHKLHSTYAVSMLEKLHEGRLHADFDQRGARTGRFSCRKPNLTNIPVRRSKQVRDLFIAPPGWKLIVGDYNQIELRLLAHFSKDPLLIKAYQEGLDLHTLTAKAAYKVEEPTPLQRSLAKNCNFSMAYGAMAQTLVDRYGVPTEREAQKLIDAFFGTYVKVQPWRQSVIRECRARRITREEAAERGCLPTPAYVLTVLGRRRRLPDIWSSAWKIRSAAERQAVNSVIQGSAGDVLKLAMVRLYSLLVDTKAALLMCVHDELVVQAPEDEVEEVAVLVKDAMENIPLPEPLGVPLLAEVKVCSRWSEK